MSFILFYFILFFTSIDWFQFDSTELVQKFDLPSLFYSVIGFSPQGFDYRNVMDPEPGRCRRTDGKKWRCSKDVVPDQKYCERHMHRGRQRSRKPVEAPAIASHVTRPTFNSSMESENSKTDLTIAVPLSLQLMAPSSNNTSTGNNTATTTTTTNNNNNQRETNFSGNKQTSATTAAAISDKERNYFKGNKNFNTTSLALAAITKNESSDNANDSKDFTTIMNMAVSTTSNNNSKRKRTDNMDEENGRNRASDNINRSRNNGNDNNVGSNVSPGLDFSPKSVLQGETSKTEERFSFQSFTHRHANTNMHTHACTHTHTLHTVCLKNNFQGLEGLF